MKYVSLFAGIGGFDLALNRLGHECVYVNEWDKYSAQTYEKNFGHKNCWEHRERTRSTKCLLGSGDCPYSKGKSRQDYQDTVDTRDITTISTDDIPDHDLLVGGFPCQSFSIAGKRRGFDDTRGTLFFDIARILKAKHTRLFILENVKGLLSHDNGRTFKTIISTLVELGYDLQWQVLNSKNFGVPQNRERVFIVGHLRGTPRPKVFPITESNGGDIEAQRESQSKGQRVRGNIASTLAQRDYKGGNNLIQLNQPTHSNDRVYAEEGISPTLNTMQGGRRQPKVMQIKRVGNVNPSGNGQSGNVVSDNGISFTIAAGGGNPNRFPPRDIGYSMGNVLTGMKIRRLTPIECERLQGFPDDWTKGVSMTQRYKQLGNAVTVNVVYEVAKEWGKHI